jgi:hypothetical protein
MIRKSRNQAPLELFQGPGNATKLLLDADLATTIESTRPFHGLFDAERQG